MVAGSPPRQPTHDTHGVATGTNRSSVECPFRIRCHRLLSGFHPTQSTTFPPLSLQSTVSSLRSQSRIANGVEEIVRSEEHTSELQSRQYLVCRLLLENKKTNTT